MRQQRWPTSLLPTDCLADVAEFFRRRRVNRRVHGGARRIETVGAIPVIHHEPGIRWQYAIELSIILGIGNSVLNAFP